MDFFIFTESFLFSLIVIISMVVYSFKFERKTDRSLKILYVLLFVTVFINAVSFYTGYESLFLNIFYFEAIVATFVVWWIYSGKVFISGLLRYLPFLFILVEEIFPCGIPLTCFCIMFLLVIITFMSQYRTIRRDNLTKLLNRYGLDEEISDQLDEYKKDKNDLFYVLVCDMDNFKHINDTWGHLEGDRALKLIADTLKKVSDKYNSPVFRIGGDEFVIIVDTATDKLPLQIRNELKIKLASLDFRDDFIIKMSIGMAKYDGKSNISELLNKADMELYEVKKASKMSKV